MQLWAHYGCMRTHLARLLAILVVACGLVPLTAGASWACSCMADQRPDSERYAAVADSTDVAYVGVVTAREGGTAEPPYQYTYRIQVERSLRGAMLGERSVTMTAFGSACGVRIPEGTRILVTSEPFGSCGGVTGTDVDARADLVAAALARAPSKHRVTPGETLRSIGTVELRAQGVAEPTVSQTTYAVRALRAANRKALGGRRNQLRVGSTLLVPRLI